MTSLQITPERKVTLLMAGAAVVLAVTFVVLLMPKPTVKMSENARAQAKFKIQLETQEKESLRAKALAAVLPRVWNGTPDQVAPVAMSTVTGLVRKHNLRLVAFRPQRVVAEGELTQVPFLISLEGPFPSVAKFVREFDSSASRLAVNLIQVASADPANDRVNATVGAVAFLKPEEPKAKPKEENRGNRT